jgi:3-hydroxyisobutyrate dehydrogenase-like beta-hydroxyacid dehydrogenase
VARRAGERAGIARLHRRLRQRPDAQGLGLAVEAAMGVGASIPLGELARNLYAMNSQAGHGGLDFSSVVKLVAKEKHGADHR